jgi:hypothetical protein
MKFSPAQQCEPGQEKPCPATSLRQRPLVRRDRFHLRSEHHHLPARQPPACQRGRRECLLRPGSRDLRDRAVLQLRTPRPCPKARSSFPSAGRSRRCCDWRRRPPSISTVRSLRRFGLAGDVDFPFDEGQLGDGVRGADVDGGAGQSSPRLPDRPASGNRDRRSQFRLHPRLGRRLSLRRNGDSTRN